MRRLAPWSRPRSRFAQTPDPDGYLSALVAGLATGAIVGIVIAAVLWSKELGTLAPIAIGGIITVCGGAISVIAATVVRRRKMGDDDR